VDKVMWSGEDYWGSARATMRILRHSERTAKQATSLINNGEGLPSYCTVSIRTCDTMQTILSNPQSVTLLGSAIE